MMSSILILSVMLLFLAAKMEEDWGAEVAAEMEPTLNVVEIPEVKLFGKWPTDEVQVGDMSLQDYIACRVSHFLPHLVCMYVTVFCSPLRPKAFLFE